ncbi:MAG TPA: peptidylprolyl isomerase [Candidatus Aenigmarchaeota archaeon]|nr:peptidylprolyl isomerase [Candidatus Aenigmarchaeota archaeon]
MKEGDFVEIDYVGRIKESGEIFDLTSEEVAKKEGIYNPSAKYGPVTIVVGAGMVIPGVEKQIKKMKVGEEKEFDVKPEDGFGRRDPSLVKVISITKFFDNDIKPVPGLYVEVDGKEAKVQSVSGGRVMVDFNNPLAGKELHYTLKILRKVTDTEEKVKALLSYYGIPYTTVKILDKKLEVYLSNEISKELKAKASENIKKWVKELESVQFKEEKKIKRI